MSEYPLSWTAGPKWFAVYTNIKCEFRAEKGLAAKGIRVFVPRRKYWVSHARMKRAVERPLLTRYIFFEIDPNKDSFEEIRVTDGVESIVSNGGCPIAMPKGFIEDMITRQLKGEFDEVAKDLLPVGAKVKVVSGPWDDFWALVTKTSPIRGGMVMAKILGTGTHTRMSYWDVRA